MKPHIETLPEKRFIGKRLSMTFANDKTPMLWKDFMPERKEIKHAVGSSLYCIKQFKPTFSFSEINPNLSFYKWATVEVSSFDSVPDGMATFVMESGLYAVFDYKGLSTDSSIFHYIFETWLPQSDYELDYRPQFEILGEKYKNNDPASEEQIWIPIKRKVH